MIRFPLNFLVIVLLIIASCSKDDQNIVSLDKYDVEIGSYFLLSESIVKLPYLDKTKAVFIDSNNNSITLDIFEWMSDQPVVGHLIKYGIYDEGDTVRYHYESLIKGFRMSNDSLGIQFEITLRARPYYPDPESRYIADVLNIFCVDPRPEIYSSQVFYHLTNKRTWPTSADNPPIAEIEFLGKKFQEVLVNNFSSPKSTVYFNYEFGIVSFTDMEGKLWRFEMF